MKCLVTGAAGFIGSHLCERLLRDGHSVVGIDAFIPYYPRTLKEANLQAFKDNPSYRHFTFDLRTDKIAAALDGVDIVFHLAAMPGLAMSWTDFDLYQSCNLTATHRLLEAVRTVRTVKRFIYASTSSVYGKFSIGDESIPVRPISPYGVTKLAAENLCRSYEELGLPLVVLRYFSVYGPRQRPDMGYHRFISALLEGRPITVFGDGEQVRGNTYIDDCTDATTAAMMMGPVGEVYNLGGGEKASVWTILEKLQAITGCRAVIQRKPARPGDQRSTVADTTKLHRLLGWNARVTLDEGLKRQIAWQQQMNPGLPALKAA